MNKRKVTVFISQIVLLLTLFYMQVAGATNYFSWGVETDSTSVPGQKNLGFQGSTSRSSATAHTGTFSMMLSVRGNDGGNNQMGADIYPHIKTPFNVVGGPAMYYRWWMKIMPGFSWGSGTAKAKSSRVGGLTYPRVYTGYVQADGFNLGECDDVGSAQPGGGCIDPGPFISYDMRSKDDGQWHEYIVMVKINTTPTGSDGQFKVWVDGTLVGQKLNFPLHNKDNNGFDEGWSSWMVKPYFQLNGTSSDGGVIYVDDFSTDDTWNSSLSAPPLWPSNIQ